MPIVFVSGTDTGCGKTYASCALIYRLRAQGYRVAGYKPVAAGCEQVQGQWQNEDALALLEASTPGLTYEQVNPVALPSPIAPHLAAREVGQEIAVPDLIQGAQALAQNHDWVVVEGAGGFLVPLNEREDFEDMVSAAGWPVILVVGMRLGCLNHALLSARAIRAKNPLIGWVANVLPPRQPLLEENIESLHSRLPAPYLGQLLENAGLEEAAKAWDLAPLQENDASL